MNQPRNIVNIGASLSLLLSIAQPLPAADVSWTATTNNGQWTNTSNWSGGVLPGAADNVFLTNGFTTWLDLSASTAPTISNLTIGTNGSSSLRLFGNTGVLTVSEAITVTGGGDGRLVFSATDSNSTYYALQTPLLNATSSTVRVSPGSWLTVGPDSTWNLGGIDLNTESSASRANFRINGATVNVTGNLNAYGVMLSRASNETSTLFMDAGMLTAQRIGIGRRQSGFQNAGTGSLEWTGGAISNRAGVDMVFNSYDITDNYGFQINLTNAGDKTLSVESGRIAHVGPNANNFSAPGVIAGTNTSGAYLTGTEGRLVIAGGGTVRLYQSNSYSGQVKIDNGTLTLVGGSQTFDGVSGTYSGSIAPSALEIATAGTLDLQNGTGLGGSGTVSFTGGLLRFSSNSVADLSGRIANSTGAIRIDTGTNTVTFASALASNNTGGLTKTGNGTLVLSGANAYSGTTTVQEGSLIVNNTSGSGTGTGSLTVSSGATLGGSGSIAGDTTVAGTLLPGNSPGVLDFGGDLTLEGAVVMELNGLTRGTQYDGINVGGELAYGGTLTLNFGSTFSEGDSFNLFDFASTTGSFESITFTGAYTGALANNAGTWTGTIGGQDFSFLDSTGNLNVVPEPSTYALLVLAAAGLWAVRKRRRSN